MVHPLITLYPSTETKFETNGLGSLAEAISCDVIEVANGSFELEMVYPVSGRRYKELTNRSIIFTKPNPIDPPQPFRIYQISKPINGLVTFFAAHISYDLSGYPVRPFSAENVVDAMSGLKTNSITSHPFTFWTDKNVASKLSFDIPTSTRSILGGSQNSILDIYKGEYKFDRFVVRLYMNRGADHGVVIRYGKNLTDLKQEENFSKVYTGVLPYWYKEEEDKKTLVQLPELIVDSGGVYNFTNVLTLDLSSEFEEPPTEDELRTRTQKYIEDNEVGVPKVSLTISFAQLEQTEEYKDITLLERVELFDTISVEFPEMGVSSKAKVCQTNYNALSGRYNSVTIGEVRASLYDTVVEQEETITQEVDETKSELRKAIENATNWIVNGRGYMVAVKDEAGNWMEICSLDTPDINTAVNVWRWNNGGFGHSSHGYNGPYETAITQDGHIVANFITTGTLTASLIRAGILKSIDKNETFYLDLEKGILRMKATELSISGRTVDEISEEKAKDAAQNAVDTAVDMATDIAQDEAQKAVDNQTQAEIFNKLTNNGKTQGIYMKNGLLYLNASYIKAGAIIDSKGNNSWDLESGLLTANNIIARGTFSCGSSTEYLYLNNQAQMQGYKNGTSIGYIDYSATMLWLPDGSTKYGMQIQARDMVRISSPLLAVAASSNISDVTTTGLTGTISQPLVASITTSVGDDSTIKIWDYTFGYFQLNFINGILTGCTTVGGGGVVG